MAVDRIVTANKVYTAGEWKALPLTERIGLIKDAQFFDGQTSVPARDAIEQLKT